MQTSALPLGDGAGWNRVRGKSGRVLGPATTAKRGVNRWRGGKHHRRDHLAACTVGGSWSGKRDSNPRLRPWQGRTLPLSYSRSSAKSQRTTAIFAQSRRPATRDPCGIVLHSGTDALGRRHLTGNRPTDARPRRIRQPRGQNGVRLGLAAGFVTTIEEDLDYDRRPSPGRRQTDRTFSLTLGYRF